MNDTTLKLGTPYGNHYSIHTNGEIERLDMPGHISGQWRMLGIQHVQRREFIPLAQLQAGKLPAQLRYKNGNPQWTVRDWDHGTTRVWGNTKHHGISYLIVEY